MDNNKFETVTHAKCILAGEHAVIRGCPALVFPVQSKHLNINYIASDDPIKADFDAFYGENLLIFLWSVIQSGMKLLNRVDEKLTGKFFLMNNIPMASGLGFSSAICAAVTQWFIWKNWLDPYELFSFARTLEDEFHGKSSGVDIAGSLSHEGIVFSVEKGIKKIHLHWKPYLYISSSDQRSSTAACVKQVQKLWLTDKPLAEYLDQEMKNSVNLAEEALSMNEENGLLRLIEAINKANYCFHSWGLVSQELQTHIDFLLAQGAVAAKPTGSGAGGYILSLWAQRPDDSLGLTPLFDHAEEV